MHIYICELTMLWESAGIEKIKFSVVVLESSLEEPSVLFSRVFSRFSRDDSFFVHLI